MAKYLETNAGQVGEVQPVNASAGAGDANKMIELDAAGKLDSSMMPAGLGAEDYSLIAFESIGAGELINIFDDAGTPKIRLADATDASKPAMGFSPVAIAPAATGTVRIGNGVITGLTGLTLSVPYFLSAVAGGITTTAPTATGNLIQRIGRAKSTTELSYVDDTSTIVLV